MIKMDKIGLGYSEVVLDASMVQQLMPGAYSMRILIDNRVVGVQQLIKQ
jgi:hypothetical protein